MRISDWSSDVCSSDLYGIHFQKNRRSQLRRPRVQNQKLLRRSIATLATPSMPGRITACRSPASSASTRKRLWPSTLEVTDVMRSEEHTSELQSLIRITYAVFVL